MSKFIELPSRNDTSLNNVIEVLENSVKDFKVGEEESIILIVSVTTKIDEERLDKDPEYAQKIDPDNHGYDRINTQCFKAVHRPTRVTASEHTLCFERLCEFEVLCDERRTVTNFHTSQTEYGGSFLNMESMAKEILTKYVSSEYTYDVDLMLMNPNEYAVNTTQLGNRISRQCYIDINLNNLLHYHGF